MSVKEAYSSDWKEKVRTRIKRLDGAIVLVSKNSIKSTGQKWEIACAKEEKKKIRGIYAYSDDRTDLAGVSTYTCTDKNINDFIDSLYYWTFFEVSRPLEALPEAPSEKQSAETG
jgi:hypothetical protein